MRRLFLRNDWVGYPLRKDYDADPEINPVRLESEETLDATPTFEADSHDGEVSEKENILFEEDEYVVNIGPQHPATHGVLRFRVSLEGEIVKRWMSTAGTSIGASRNCVKASPTRKRWL